MKLEAKDLSAGYGGASVLEGVNLTVRSGSFTVLAGPNGSGKSTLFKCLGRLLKPLSGTVSADGADIRGIPTRELARKLAVLPQFHPAPPGLSVAELVALGRFPHRGPGGFFSRRDRAAAEAALEAMELTALRERKLGTLSGGERQRAWIAMMIAQEPDTLLLDEPAAYLDICCQLETVELLRKLNRERGVTIAAVLHDLDSAARCADHLVMIREGKVYCEGTPAELLTPEILREVFGVEAEIVTARDGARCCLAIASARRRSRP